MIECEQELSGGNLTPVVRVGDTVRRRAGPWTPTVHRLLTHLQDAGISWVPSPGGFDSAGREILSFIAGSAPHYPMPEWIWSDEILQDAAARLRAVHDATEHFDADDSLWMLPAHEPAEVICHNDFAQYNLIFRGHEIVGAIDFDTASPGPRVWDVAYLAYRLIPLNTRDRTNDSTGEKRRRVRLLLEAYGANFSADELIATASARLNELAEFTDDQATRQSRSDLAEHAGLYRSDAVSLLHWLS